MCIDSTRTTDTMHFCRFAMEVGVMASVLHRVGAVNKLLLPVSPIPITPFSAAANGTQKGRKDELVWWTQHHTPAQVCGIVEHERIVRPFGRGI